jgi:hypothetical protein
VRAESQITAVAPWSSAAATPAPECMSCGEHTSTAAGKSGAYRAAVWRRAWAIVVDPGGSTAISRRWPAMIRSRAMSCAPSAASASTACVE